MARQGIDEKHLDRMRFEKAWWWAAWMTPLCYLGWLAVLVGAAVLLANPDVVLAQTVLGLLGFTVLAAVVKAIAVEYLIRRRLDRSTRYSMRSLDRDLNRRQIYRATRDDALKTIGQAIVAFLDNLILWP